MEGNIYFKPCNVLRQSGFRAARKAALSEGRIASTVLLSLLVGTAVTEAGLMAGRFAAEKGQRDLGWLNGLLLIAVGIGKL